ncbi:MAG: hypothetical protein A3H02_00565, partial [Candidatus Niyogibacteria bacterium RIFCSPLOWO2_12_FULL_41_13]
MVRKIFLKILSHESVGVHQAAFLLAITALAAKFLALYRDRLLASAFGAGQTLDIYYASFRVPDIVYALSLFLASSAVLIPLILQDEKRAKDLVNQISTFFLIALIILIAAVYFLMPFLNDFIVPGFDAKNKQEVVNLSRILLFSPLFLGFSNIVSSVLQSYRRFFVYALSPIFYNLGIISGILIFYPIFGLNGIIFGVVLGAFLHLIVQMPSFLHLGFALKPSFHLKKETVLEIVGLSFPRALTLSFNQIGLIIITAIGSFIGSGSIAIFNLAMNLYSVPLALFGVSYSIAAFPLMAKNAAEKDEEKFLSQVGLTIRHIIFWSMPALILIIVLRAHIVRVILGAGNFGWVDTRLTAAALALFSFSILFQGLIMLYLRAFYAAKRTFLPLVLNAISLLFTVGVLLFILRLFGEFPDFRNWFENILRVKDLPGAEMLVLPLSYTLGGFLNLILLHCYFRKDFGKFGGPDFWLPIFQICLASLIIGGSAFWFLRIFDGFFNLETFFGIFFHGFVSGGLGIALGTLFLKLIKNQEFLEVTEAFRNRFWREKPISGEPE